MAHSKTPATPGLGTPVLTGRNRRRLVGGLLAVLAIGGIITAVATMKGSLPKPVVAGDPKARGLDDPLQAKSAITVKAYRPKQDPSVQITVEQLGNVEAYYQADLRARVSGLVKSVYKDIGDHVNMGDLLIEIDVPELVQDVAQREAVVLQRQQELRVSEAMKQNTEAGRLVAKAVIREKLALVEQAEATRDLRKKRLDRMLKLVATDSVVAGVIDEEERDFKASAAAVSAASAAVEKSRADALEAESKIAAAIADTELKAALVEVARRDLDRARALVENARITAPYEGVIVRRTVDPGSFVQNATTGQSDTLISVARTDMVTFSGRFTDAAAPFVAVGMPAELTFASLPGLTVHGKVTRFAPSIQNSDRTMRVEVDLFNGSDEEHDKLMYRICATNLTSLSPVHPLGRATSHVAGFNALAGMHKGEGDLFSLGSQATLPQHTGGNLIPGMTGTMKLVLNKFLGGYVVPSTAVYTRGGASYVLVVENGLTKQKPVQVQVSDGRVAKIAFLTRNRDAAGVVHDGVSELTGQELVVAGRQLELGEGQRVQPSLSDW